jgi:allantoin racemase
MTGRILHVLPIVTTRWNEAVRDAVHKVASRDFEHHFVNIKYGALDGFEGLYDVAVSVPYIVDEMLEAQKAGYDAVTSLCVGGPGVKEGREVVKIPVVGAGEAALYVAMMCGERIAVITVGGTYRTRQHGIFLNELRRMTALFGITGRVVSYRTTGMECATCDESTTYDALSDEGRKALEEGAEVLVLGCTGMLGVTERLQDKLGVPVVDPTMASVKYAELLVAMNLTHSKLTSPSPSLVGAQAGKLKWPDSLRHRPE